MGKTDVHNKDDDDILQCKQDILRAQDIIPGGSAAAQKKPGSLAEQIEGRAKATKRGGEKTAEQAAGPAENGDIPKFDLAEEIMAQQRMITAIRRSSPKKIQTQSQKRPLDSSDYTTEQAALAQQDRIIAEIVAKDIERLCRAGHWNQRK